MKPNLEAVIYGLTWTSVVGFAMYRLHLVGLAFADVLGDDLVRGSFGWKHKKDTADYEWTTFSSVLLHWLPFVSLHIIISRITRYCTSQTSTVLVQILVSLGWISVAVGVRSSLVITTQLILLFLLFRHARAHQIWIVILLKLVLFDSQYSSYVKNWVVGGDEDGFYVFTVLATWTYARAISFCCDCSSGDSSLPSGLLQLLHYALYLPLLPTGPLVPYKDFASSVTANGGLSGSKIGLLDLFNVLRYSFWWLFHEVCLHFFYHSALQYHPEIVRTFDTWTLAGLGYCLGQFFMIKYTVLYGLPSAVAKLDGIGMLPAPKCVGRIHLYSQMWRDFDRGLYLFMLRYIYIPCMGKSSSVGRKYVASALCFLFICAWHSASDAVIVWCVLNYLGLCVESLAKHLARQPAIASIKASLGGEMNLRRLEALLCAPLLLMSALSNFFFFSSFEVGSIFVRRVFIEGSLLQWTSVLGALYCCCHVSISVSQWERRRKQHAD